MTLQRHGTVVLLGDLDVAYPLRQAGIPVTVLQEPTEGTRFSRARIDWAPRPADPAALVPTLLDVARQVPAPVALLVQGDRDLHTVSRERERLAGAFSFVLPTPDVVEVLLDKERFQVQARDLDLPVPPGCAVATAGDGSEARDLVGPLLVKPTRRREGAEADGFAGSKAGVVADHAELRELLVRLRPVYDRVLVQELVAGPEANVESYHVYVDADGTVRGAFTGRKLRTTPASFGYSTALVTTDAADVAALGQRVMDAFDVRGFAKVDVKRDADGRLWLFEVNTRCTLWHRLGAAAGCNLPALAFDEAAGLPAPSQPVTARAGVAWCRQPRDLLVARADGVGLARYLAWLARCEAVAGLRVSDPWPFVRGSLLPQAAHLRRRGASTPT
jgi:D-aspartate ligase